MTMGKTRTSCRASYPNSDQIATSTKKKRCSHDRRKRRENDRSNQSDNTANRNGPNKDDDKEKYQCCGKFFDTERGLKIHQGKVCKRKEKVQHRGQQGHKTSGETPPDSNHSGSNTTVETQKKKIKWPKACDTKEYEKFDEEVNALVGKHKGTIEQRLASLAETIYNEGEKRFGLEQSTIKKNEQNTGTSRRQKEINKVKAEKKQLRSRWMKAKTENEKEGLNVLYEDVKKKLRDMMRKERKLKRRREKVKTRKSFIRDPYKFAKGIFTESKSGTLKCTKEELESHLQQTYSDPRRAERLPHMRNLKRPTKPGVQFDLSDLKAKEYNDFIKKALAKSSPGNDGVSYEVYKKCSRLRNRLFLLLRKMWKTRDVADRWAIAEGLYLPKEENSEELGQFRPISLLNIDGKIMFGIIAKRIIDFARANGYIDETIQKAGVPNIPGCVEHAYSIWEEIQNAKEKKSDLSVIWLDLANAYGSVPHAIIEEAMEFFWIPEEVRKMIMLYYDKFLMRFTTNDFTTDFQRLEVGIAAGCTISVVLFVLVMEMILKSTNVEVSVMNKKLKAFMDDITLLTENIDDAKRALERLDELITWSRMKFKAKKLHGSKRKA